MQVVSRTSRYKSQFHNWTLGQQLYESYELSSARNMVTKCREDYPKKTWESLTPNERNHWERVALQPIHS